MPLPRAGWERRWTRPAHLRFDTRVKTVILALVVLLPVAASAQSAPPRAAAPAATAHPPLTRAAEVLVPASLNVFRRFTADGPRTLAFYGEVLGLKTMQTIGQVYRFQVGTSEVKFSPGGRNRTFTRGGMQAAADFHGYPSVKAFQDAIKAFCAS